MQVSAGDIRRAHERFGRIDEIIAQRRTVYAVAVELFGRAGDAADLGDDVLDNPAVRGHLGEVLSGPAALSPGRLRSLNGLVADGFATVVGGCPVRLASTPSAATVLAPALRKVGAELERHGDENRLALLTSDAGPAIAEAWHHVVEGVRLAAHVAPDLALDLLPHVALFGVTAHGGSARLGSASAREFPGLVLIPAPHSALEVAEALIHEGAHSKFFDMGTVRSLLGPLTATGPRFLPSWAPPSAPSWPVEQALAAWHAYCCLAAFARSLRKHSEWSLLPEDSLLPKAGDRVREIGRWLRLHGPFLGADAHELIAVLDGERPRDPVLSDHEGDVRLAQRAVADPGFLVRPSGSRVLLARRGGTPPELLWADRAALGAALGGR